MKKKLNRIDVNFLNLESDSTHQKITNFTILDSIPNVENLKGKIFQLTEIHPELKQKIHHNKYWIHANNFELSNHFEHIVDNSINSDEDLTRSCSKVISTKLDLNKPLWKFTLVSNQESNNKECFCAFLLSFHHALLDGLGIVDLSARLFDESRENSLLPKVQNKSYVLFSKKKRKRRSKLKILNLRNILYLSKKFFLKKYNSPFNKKISSNRLLHLYNIPLTEFNLIRRNLHGSSNQIYLCLVQMLIQKYYKLKKLNLNSKLRVILPVSLRDQKEIDTVFGNHLTGITLDIYLNKNSPEEILYDIKKRLFYIQKEKLIGAYALLGTINSFLPKTIQRFVCNFQARKNNFICTHLSSIKNRFLFPEQK